MKVGDEDGLLVGISDGMLVVGVGVPGTIDDIDGINDGRIDGELGPPPLPPLSCSSRSCSIRTFFSISILRRSTGRPKSRG